MTEQNVAWMMDDKSM